MIREVTIIKKIFPLIALLSFLISCSHKYNSDVLDLSFYQWNQWPDKEAVFSSLPFNSPTCGWEVLHRGNGNLVRIPATIEDYSGVSWYHCRFTLPEIWEHRKIVMSFEGAGPEVEVYLNKALVSNQSGGNPFQVDLTDQIFYTLDNHLAIRINDPEGGGGISGNILVISSVGETPPEN